MIPGDTPAREDLGFVNAARGAFGALMRDYGLNELGSDVHTVHYQGAPGWLVVTHDPLSYELEVAFSPADHGGDRPFGMVDFIRVVDRAQADNYRSFAATSPDALLRGVKKLADDLRQYAEPALSSDCSFLARVAEVRQEAIADFEKDATGRREVQAADEAMREHDWARIVGLYERREDHLSRVEKKRLALARKRLADD